MRKFNIHCGVFAANTSGDCKRIHVQGPKGFDLAIEIDFDDVAQDRVFDQTVKLLAILNANWK